MLPGSPLFRLGINAASQHAMVMGEGSRSEFFKSDAGTFVALALSLRSKRLSTSCGQSFPLLDSPFFEKTSLIKTQSRTLVISISP